MPKERVTYVTYNEGVEAKNLHLGNLVHDYQTPNSLDPYIEHEYTDVAEPTPTWAQSTALENYALTLMEDSPKELQNTHKDLADDSAAYRRYSVAAAAKATILEVENPGKFFTEITLSSDEARKWLVSRLSAAEHLTGPQGRQHPRPQIWMLTGLILMTHATWTSLSTKDQSFIVSDQAPFDPTGVSKIRRLSVSDGVKPTVGMEASDNKRHISGAIIHETGKYPGTRGWAARWQKVAVHIVSPENSTSTVKNQLKLKIPGKYVQIALDENAIARNTNDDKSVNQFDDNFWDAFLDAAEEYN